MIAMPTTPEEDLARLKNVRASHRSATTRLMTSTATLLAASPLDIDELTLKRNGLLSKLTKLEEHDAEILTKTPDDHATRR